MTRKRKNSPGFVVGATCALAMLATGPASLQTARASPDGKQPNSLAGQCLAIPAVNVFVPYQGGSFGVKISPIFPTIVRFPEWVDFGDSLTRYGDIEASRFKNTVVLQPKRQLPADLKTNILLMTDKVETTMNLSVAEPPTTMSSLVMVTPLSNKDFATRKAEAEAEQFERDVAKRQVYRKQVAALLLEMKQLLNEAPRVAALDVKNVNPGKPAYARNGDLIAVQTWAVAVQGDRYLKVTIDNQTSSQVELKSVWIRESEHYGEKVEFVAERGTRTTNDRIALVPPYEQVTGMVLVPKNMTSPLESLKVHFLGSTGLPLMVANQIVELYPMPEEERRRRRQARQLGLGVHVLGGGVWLPDGAGMGRLEMTSVTGLTVAFQKGYENGLALEIEATGGRTGEARFSSVTWEGEDGDIMRTASIGRLQAGGALRFGDKYMTALRAGIGVQGVSYDSNFAGTSGTRTGPGNSFEIGFAVYVGGAFSARFNENWALGISGAFTEAFSVHARALEMGLHIRYGWNTSTRR